MQYAQSLVFWVLGIWWLVAYVKTDSRNIQKWYYRAIAWGIPFSWLFALWTMIAFIVGGVQKKGKIGWNLFYGFLNWGVLAGLEFLAWWLVKGRAVKFYRWDEQDWWNYKEDDAPEIWPSQLGDFVDY